VGLGLTAPEEVAAALSTGRLPEVNPSGGLWATNPIFAAGLERVAEAVRRIRDGAPEALAHSSYGYAGQGQFVAVLRQAA
jgi:acetyl-CoA acetyltransferase